MTQSPRELKDRYRESIGRVAEALERGDGQTFVHALDDLVYLRQPDLFADLRQLSSVLQTALERFGADPRLIDLARKDVPDARLRLSHVLKLTNEAANTTLDFIERTAALAANLSVRAATLGAKLARVRGGKSSTEDTTLIDELQTFLHTAHADSELVRRHLEAMLLAQGYQDLTGQIIGGVIELVDQVEVALADLLRLSSGHGTTGGRRAVAERDATMIDRSHGPSVPGVTDAAVVNAQSDVDDMLSSLGL